MSVDYDPIPLFVFGKHRSGTTGLANHLCEHDRVAGVQHASHFGIHESRYFTWVRGRYGPLSSWTNFREFLEVVSASDYFQLTGVEKEDMAALYPTTYAGFFRAVMDAFARRQEAQFWLEKSPSHTKEARWLADTYPNARFVAITRDVADVVASSLRLNREALEGGERSRFAMLCRVTLGCVYYTKCIEKLRRQYPSRTVVVRYDAFQTRTHHVLRHVCDFLGVAYQQEMTTYPYARNSSFGDDEARAASMTDVERAYVRRLAEVLRTLPYEAYRSADLLRRHLHGYSDFPHWFFKLSDETLRDG